MAVQILELLEIEARGRAADIREIEPVHRLLATDDLGIAVAPTETQEIIVHRFGQIAKLVAIGVDAQRTVALRQFGAAGAVAPRYLGTDGLAPLPRPDHAKLAVSVVQVDVGKASLWDRLV